MASLLSKIKNKGKSRNNHSTEGGLNIGERIEKFSDIASPNEYVHPNSHVFLGLIPFPIASILFTKVPFLLKFFANLNPEFRKDFKAIDHSLTAEEYVGMGFVAYTFFGALIGLLLYSLAVSNGRETNVAILIALGTFFLFSFVFTYFLTKIPSSQLKSEKIDVERHLIYALKEMLLHGESGSSLYESMVAISESNYGVLSVKFQRVVRKVNTGIPMLNALEELALMTRSEYFKKTIWQFINSEKTGSELKSTIQPIIKELDDFQKSQIQNYARELNLWSLMYMMFSVAIPTIGSTMLVVLSVFANFGVTEGFFIVFVGINLLVQVFLIFFVKSRRPNVSF